MYYHNNICLIYQTSKARLSCEIGQIISLIIFYQTAVLPPSTGVGTWVLTASGQITLMFSVMALFSQRGDSVWQTCIHFYDLTVSNGCHVCCCYSLLCCCCFVPNGFISILKNHTLHIQLCPHWDRSVCFLSYTHFQKLDSTKCNHFDFVCSVIVHIFPTFLFFRNLCSGKRNQ